MKPDTNYKEIIENFEFLDDWEDRYRYLIELGENLQAISDAERCDGNKVSGCVSQVWLCSKILEQSGQPHIYFKGDSDAAIVKGLVAILIAYYSGKSASWISQNNVARLFDELGLREHLTSQRANGLNAMIERVMSQAKALN